MKFGRRLATLCAITKQLSSLNTIVTSLPNRVFKVLRRFASWWEAQNPKTWNPCKATRLPLLEFASSKDTFLETPHSLTRSLSHSILNDVVTMASQMRFLWPRFQCWRRSQTLAAISPESLVGVWLKFMPSWLRRWLRPPDNESAICLEKRASMLAHIHPHPRRYAREMIKVVALLRGDERCFDKIVRRRLLAWKPFTA